MTYQTRGITSAAVMTFDNAVATDGTRVVERSSPDKTNPPGVVLMRIGGLGSEKNHGISRGISWGTAGTRALWSARLSIPINPLSGVRLASSLLAYGFSPAIGYSSGAIRHPDRTAVIDGSGLHLSFREAEELTQRCTAELTDRGVDSDSTVAVLGRNTAGLALAMAAVARTGADLVYLNTGFKISQIEEILNDHQIKHVLADRDLVDRVPGGVSIAHLDDPESWSSNDRRRVRAKAGRHIILTSGTTGKPKGADRSQTPIEAAISLLTALPYRERATHVMAAPMFHSWGWLNHRLSALLDTTEIMVPRPSAEAVLNAAAEHRAEVIVTTPVVLRRLVEVGPGDRDLSNLRGVLISGSAIPSPVVSSFMQQFGPVLYNLYGSTEVGYATCASPKDLAEAPDTAGRPLHGVGVSILAPDRRAVPDGDEGEIWVGSAASFEGYVDGGDKDRRHGQLSTGDLGYFDGRGRLFVSGRADDLIISGGENVNPAEVEAVLLSHPLVAEVAAVGRPDPEFGEVIVAHVVPKRSALSDEGLSEMDLAARVLDFARVSLATYQCPREVIVRDELPVNATGKVLRRLL
jgi:acyl-CoA synthetase (AMP-forming)/AMP-acid ligase II